jgi:hypothetical protein
LAEKQLASADGVGSGLAFVWLDRIVAHGSFFTYP